MKIQGVGPDASYSAIAQEAMEVRIPREHCTGETCVHRHSHGDFATGCKNILRRPTTVNGDDVDCTERQRVPPQKPKHCIEEIYFRKVIIYCKSLELLVCTTSAGMIGATARRTGPIAAPSGTPSMSASGAPNGNMHRRCGVTGLIQRERIVAMRCQTASVQPAPTAGCNKV